MPRPDTRNQSKPDASSLRFRDQPAEDPERDDHVCIPFDGELVVSPDEDAGNDPYNRTGTFERCVR